MSVLFLAAFQLGRLRDLFAYFKKLGQLIGHIDLVVYQQSTTTISTHILQHLGR